MEEGKEIYSKKLRRADPDVRGANVWKGLWQRPLKNLPTCGIRFFDDLSE
jgi:hypothetical protein